MLHVTLSYFTQFKLINEQDVGQVSDTYESIFTPAGITFAIWGGHLHGASLFLYLPSPDGI